MSMSTARSSSCRATGTSSASTSLTPLQGAAVHINAFNFPVWGMLEKLAPTLLAGVPAIVKPATATSYVAEACFRMMIESGILPDGAVQFIAGGTGDLLDRLTPQDVVSFTGSAATALMLRSKPHILRQLDPLHRRAGQPERLDPGAGRRAGHAGIRPLRQGGGQGDDRQGRAEMHRHPPHHRAEGLRGRRHRGAEGEARQDRDRRSGRWKACAWGRSPRMAQRQDVMEKVAVIGQEAECVYGDPKAFAVEGADAEKGAFVPPMLFRCADPAGASRIHETEAFGPVSTVMAYDTLDDAVALANRGGGSLVMSLITHDPEVARDVARGAGAWHGRIYINDRDSMGESTGHGSPLPHMTHGGPGRAGGGEEMGGVRGVFHYMQRTAVQGSPDMLSAVAGTFVPGSTTFEADRSIPSPRRSRSCSSARRCTPSRATVTLEDIEHFANFTGDTFYAHMDEEAAKANPFFPGRVAHGYLLLSFAAGLFVEPSPGPVLANVGLEGLKFMKPVSPGDSIKVALTVKRKTKRTDTYGEVRWHVVLTNQDDETVADLRTAHDERLRERRLTGRHDLPLYVGITEYIPPNTFRFGGAWPPILTAGTRSSNGCRGRSACASGRSSSPFSAMPSCRAAVRSRCRRCRRSWAGWESRPARCAPRCRGWPRKAG
jgi:oxepin-CoA hydrolase/3-oxo-5,6-dehydrosuberyl-CoA semialdehyde dehydrogenase